MPECCADIVIDYGNLWHFFVWLTLDVFVICSTLSGVNCGQFWYFGTISGVNCWQFGYFGTPSDVNCGKLLYFGTLSGVNCETFWYSIINTLGKNKHHPGLEPMASGITSRYSTNCTTNLKRLFYLKEKQHSIQETWDRPRETGDVIQATWDRRCETGDVRKEV